MSHIGDHARATPDKPAYIMADTGDVVTYGELDARSAAGANLLRGHGLKPGDHCAVLIESHRRFFEVIWAAHRAGLIFTAISTHLLSSEIAYILANCDAQLLVTSGKLEGSAADGLAEAALDMPVYSVDAGGRFMSWDAAIDAASIRPSAAECAGMHMLYSSGTTGRPKGVYPSWQSGRPLDFVLPGMAALRDYFRIAADTVYLSPAPLYHAAPLIFNQLVMFQGGTSIIMDKFDAIEALALIERYGVTTAQFVPIMFIRMLKLDLAERLRYDHSSLERVIHAAAPCPVEIKQQMIDWWGPIIFEYYSSTENAGATLLDTMQWQSHAGSVGRPIGCAVHILAEDGEELAAGQIGEVFFENPHANFEYHKEPAATAEKRNGKGWITVGDMGYIDVEGFLYLADRKDFMIISGGVNIYPQEVENMLILHPDVADAAVFGIPDSEFGQAVKAVVQPRIADFDPCNLEVELIEWCRTKISPIKAPRSIDFSTALPRQDNGKLYKKAIVDSYRERVL